MFSFNISQLSLIDNFFLGISDICLKTTVFLLHFLWSVCHLYTFQVSTLSSSMIPAYSSSPNTDMFFLSFFYFFLSNRSLSLFYVVKHSFFYPFFSHNHKPFFTSLWMMQISQSSLHKMWRYTQVKCFSISPWELLHTKARLKEQVNGWSSLKRIN